MRQILNNNGEVTCYNYYQQVAKLVSETSIQSYCNKALVTYSVTYLMASRVTC